MSRNRYPEVKYDSDGKKLCRGCGTPVPKGRQTWCSNECYDKYRPEHVCQRVFERDGKKCVLCGDDRGGFEFDHIVPFSEGGQTIDSNMRTLCVSCHRIITREWHRKRAVTKKKSKLLQLSMSL